jgi:hypothetical protein
LLVGAVQDLEGTLITDAEAIDEITLVSVSGLERTGRLRSDHSALNV